MSEDVMERSYQAAREGAALFDLRGEGRFRVSGPRAEAALDRHFSGDLGILSRWRGLSGLFLREDASIIASATLFKGDGECHVFTDAASAALLHDFLCTQVAGEGVQVEDLADSHGCLALVGPQAQTVMANAGGDDVYGMTYLSRESNPVLDLLLFRMGFCGEYEYRLLYSSARHAALVQTLLAQGRDSGLSIADPGVMPLLMLEMRSLGKNDMPEGVDPIVLGLHWMINFRKPGLTGAAALDAARLAPRTRTLMLRLEEAGIARTGDRLQIDGTDVGFCVRVRHSPTLGKDIALACIDADYGWVGVPFCAVGAGGRVGAIGVSAPLFVTRTIRAA